jgi:hypothetical protein
MIRWSVLVAVVSGFVASHALAQTFTNNIPINFAGGSGGPATQYPSGLLVNGVGVVQYMTVTLNLPTASGGTDAAAFLLVSPSGQKVELGSTSTFFAGPTTAWTLTIADDAADFVPTLLAGSGAFKPTASFVGSYPAPAPPLPYSGSLSSTYSGTINGTWLLYTLCTGNSRTVVNNWSLTFNGVRQPQPITTTFSYQGRLIKSGTPVNGPADLRFTLWNHPTSTNTGNRVGVPSLKNGVQVEGGVFTTTLDLVSPSNSETGLWIDVEAASPPGSGFVLLSPRQRIFATPQAVRASVATTAETLSLDADARLNNNEIYLRGSTDDNHLLGWFGASKPFASVAVDGAVLAGYGGGVLGSKDNAIERIALRWTNTGRVGIQTSSPSARLHVSGDSTNDLGFLISAGGPGWGAGLRLENFGVGGRTYGMYSANDGTWQFVDQTATATRMVINSAGNVGIGTTTLPQKLNVNGVIRSTGADFMLAGRGGGQGNNGGNARAFVDAGWPGGAQGSIDGGGLFINYANDFGRVVIGSSLLVQGNITATGTITPSSARLKEHVAPLNDALEGLLKLEGVRFDWKADEAARRGGRAADLGFVAEDVEKIFPELVYRDEAGQVIGMDYARLSAVAVQAIKQQQALIRTQREELEDLKARLDRLEKLAAPRAR